jgi:uncharacterized Zn-finger protein
MEVETFKCDYYECEKQFLLVSSLQKHIEKCHSSRKPYTCNICEKKFSLQRQLSDHKKAEHSSEELKCEHCVYVTNNEKYLKQHMLCHSEDKRYRKCCFNKFLKFHKIYYRKKNSNSKSSSKILGSHKSRKTLLWKLVSSALLLLKLVFINHLIERNFWTIFSF